MYSCVVVIGFSCNLCLSCSYCPCGCKFGGGDGGDSGGDGGDSGVVFDVVVIFSFNHRKCQCIIYYSFFLLFRHFSLCCCCCCCCCSGCCCCCCCCCCSGCCCCCCGCFCLIAFIQFYLCIFFLWMCRRVSLRLEKFETNVISLELEK